MILLPLFFMCYQIILMPLSFTRQLVFRLGSKFLLMWYGGYDVGSKEILNFSILISYNWRHKYKKLAVLYSKFFTRVCPFKTVNWKILLRWRCKWFYVQYPSIKLILFFRVIGYKRVKRFRQPDDILPILFHKPYSISEIRTFHPSTV